MLLADSSIVFAVENIIDGTRRAPKDEGAKDGFHHKPREVDEWCPFGIGGHGETPY